MPAFDADLSQWRRPPVPGELFLAGRHVRIAPLVPAHAPALFAAVAGHDALWDYLGYGPFADEAAYRAWIGEVAGRPDPRFFALRAVDRPGPEGVAALMRVDPQHGSIEVGHIMLAPALQRSCAATEAIFLFADWAFDAGYRRFEWKCDARNAASRRAAARYGFAFEGVFRRHLIVKGRNRDTAWFAIVAEDWPDLRAAFRQWLEPANFDAEGRQRTRLGDLTAPARLRAEAEHSSG